MNQTTQKWLALFCCLLFPMTVLTACGTAEAATDKTLETKTKPLEGVRSEQSLGDGLTFCVYADESEGSLVLGYTCETDSSVYNLAETSTSSEEPVAQQSSLVEISDSTKITADPETGGKGYTRESYVCFPVPIKNRTDYRLNYAVELLLGVKKSETVSIQWKEKGAAELGKKILLPDGHWVAVNSVTLEETDGKKYAAVSYTKDMESLSFELSVTKSKVSTGAASGTFTELEGGKDFIYRHPIGADETEIEIQFDTFSYHKVFTGTMDLK